MGDHFGRSGMSLDRFATWAVVYILLSLLCLAMVMGSVSRGEMPFWIWEWVTRSRGDIGGIVFAVLLYLLVYSTFFVYPYAALRAMYPSDKERAVLIALWVMVSILMFHNELSGAVASLAGGFEGGGTLWQWLTVLWLAFTALAIVAWRQMIESKYRAKFDGERGRG